jgi:type 1 glutamine amidotransferase
MNVSRRITMDHRSPRPLLALPLVALFACGELDQPLGDVPSAGHGGSAGTSGGTTGASAGDGGAATGGTGGSSSGLGGSGNAPSRGGSANAPSTGGSGNETSTGGSANAPSTGGSAGTAASGGSGNAPSTGGSGNETSTGGSAGTAASGGSANAPSGGAAGTAGNGGTAGATTDPYAPRTGPFRVLAYSNTQIGYRHNYAIDAGRIMLMAMATKQGFEVTFSESPDDFSAESLAQYELLFGLNPSGNSLDQRPAERAAFEEWMVIKNGAFAGVHSSTDFMNGWDFWAEVTGQYHDGHDVCCSGSEQGIQWEASAADFVAVAGLPSPWVRSEEWFYFKSWEQWSTKPGFRILSFVTTPMSSPLGGGTRPVSYIREWGNFRSFYTSLGHDGSNYDDPDFIHHVAAGIMWAVRREALFRP